MRAILALSALVSLTVACGGGSPTSPSPGSLTPLAPASPGTSLSRGTMSAVVDGTRWEAATPTALLGGLAGLTSLLGSASLGGLRIHLVFSFTAVSGPGVSPASRTVTDGTFDLSQ